MLIRFTFSAFLFIAFFTIHQPIKAQERTYEPPEFAKKWGKPDVHPDHIVLNLTADPATSASVTWRTSTKVERGVAEIAIATAAPKFWRNAKTIEAKTEVMDASKIPDAKVISHYHSVTFQDLMPDTVYAYRVGDGKIWSEWIQFRTASKEPKPFSFLYVGDAQNYILELWSRLIRQGYKKAPDASFIIHAGDLINNAHNEKQWHEWFTAGGWIHSMLPSVPLPGNHEYGQFNRKDKESPRYLSMQWNPQFTLPENGLPELRETNYFIDYQDTKIIVLDSNREHEKQAEWLEKVLSGNTKKWTIVTYHHPLFSASSGRDSPELRALWKPIFDKYNVDLSLQGHDHSYARGHVAPVEGKNVVSGLNMRDATGTVYVVSVSGGKMYNLRPNGWEDYGETRDRGAENTQLFQVINVNGDTLSYEAYTATGELYDAFDIIKNGDGKPNTFVEKKQNAIPARRHDNTIKY